MNEQITAAIAAGIPGAVVDVAVDGNRALITVVSDTFEGMTRVRKQQAVYGCIQQFIADGSLHAVTIRALTPAETA
jgi:acid stress-induced BolA-like protein IbaG/YrbA